MKYAVDIQKDEEFDVWEFPQKCEKCGWFDNYDEKEPLAYLDANYKLCEECFEYEKERTAVSQCSCFNGCTECLGEHRSWG